MYRTFACSAAVSGWSREIVYLRPDRFVVLRSDHQRQRQLRPVHGLALSRPVRSRPQRRRRRAGWTSPTTASSWGSMTTVLPVNAATTTVPIYPDSNPVKVWQVQVRPPERGTTQPG